MLRITVELVPYGDESQASVISQGIIYNDATHSKNESYGNYIGKFTIDGETLTTRVTNFPRHSRCLSLIQRVLGHFYIKPVSGENMETR